MIDAGDGLSLGLHPPSKSAAAPTPTPGMFGSIQVGLNVRKPLAQFVETLWSRGVSFQQHRQDPIVNDGAVKLAFFCDPDGTAVYLCDTAQPLHGANPRAPSVPEPRRSFTARQVSHGARLKLSRSACPAVSPATSRRASCGTRP